MPCLVCYHNVMSCYHVTLLCSVLAGWGEEVFTLYPHWWLVPVLACHGGALLGAGAYLLLVQLHHPQQQQQQQQQQEVQQQSEAAPPPPPHQHQQQKPSVQDVKVQSLTKSGFGSNFLNVGSSLLSRFCKVIKFLEVFTKSSSLSRIKKYFAVFQPVSPERASR